MRIQNVFFTNNRLSEYSKIDIKYKSILSGLASKINFLKALLLISFGIFLLPDFYLFLNWSVRKYVPISNCKNY